MADKSIETLGYQSHIAYRTGNWQQTWAWRGSRLVQPLAAQMAGRPVGLKAVENSPRPRNAMPALQLGRPRDDAPPGSES